jgi:hypothetical protein
MKSEDKIIHVKRSERFSWEFPNPLKKVALPIFPYDAGFYAFLKCNLGTFICKAVYMCEFI